jgi:hypothetical protein
MGLNLALWVVAPLLVAQPWHSGAGRIGGDVYDQAGRPLAGVKVTATGAQGEARVTYSDREGHFTVAGLPLDSFSLALTAPLFRPAHAKVAPTAAQLDADLDVDWKVEVLMELEPTGEEVVLPVGCIPTIPHASTVPIVEPGPYERAWMSGVRLVIREEGQRELMLGFLHGKLTGRVRGEIVDVQVKPAEITGHLAGQPVRIGLHGQDAQGEIGGHEVAFTLAHVPGGHLLRGQTIGHTVRLEQAYGVLSWLPGCDLPLVRLPRTRAPETIFQGSCASGRRMMITVPDAFAAVPPLPRLILLALLLSEREELSDPRLFPEKVTP